MNRAARLSRLCLSCCACRAVQNNNGPIWEGTLEASGLGGVGSACCTQNRKMSIPGHVNQQELLKPSARQVFYRT